MTTRLTAAERTACLSRLSLTFGKATEDWDQAEMNNFMDLVDPASTYPAPAVYAAVEHVCANYTGYLPKPGDVNAALRTLTQAAIQAADREAITPTGLDPDAYRAWLRERREETIAKAFSPQPLAEAVQASQALLDPYRSATPRAFPAITN